MVGWGTELSLTYGNLTEQGSTLAYVWFMINLYLIALRVFETSAWR